MKKLWPLEDNCTQLKDNFASCEITKVNLRNFRKSCFNLRNPPMYSQIFATNSFRFFFFRYLLFKSLFFPCNPPIIGFLSQEVRRKGEQSFFIIYCNFLLKYLGSFSQRATFVQFEESNTQSFALPYLLILIVFFSLAKQTLRMFSQRMSGQAFCFLE